jgi:hypothetical protein
MLRCLVIGAALLAANVSTAVQAQIYESKDAQGNTVYSDTAVPGAKQVELPATSIADPVPPPDSSTEPPVTTPHSTGRQHGKVMSPGEEGSERRHEVLDADQRHEVLDADSRHEVMDAEPRHEVLDANSRHEVMGAEPRREVLDAER